MALLHPFPSALNALVVAAIASVAGASAGAALTLATAMFGFQIAIGALNDLVDAPADGHVKPSKPIPSGLVTPRQATVVVVVGAATGIALSASVGLAALALGTAGFACGVAYDLWLKARGLGWLAYTGAFPLLLLFAWTGAGGGLPPGWALLLPVAALAGPALHLANTLTDLEHDRAVGGDGLAMRLGRARAVAVLGVMLGLVHCLAWIMLAEVDAPPAAIVLAGAASGTGVAGFIGTARGTPRSTAWGWSLQAMSIAALAVAWVVAAAG